MYLSLVPVPYKKSRVVVKKVKAKYMKVEDWAFPKLSILFQNLLFLLAKSMKSTKKYEK